MVIAKMIAIATFVLWLGSFILLLPVYFIRRKISPRDEGNTLKALLIKTLIASLIFSLIFCSGFIKMYIDELNGI